MIKKQENPSYVNSFLDYSATILNKSPNSIREYNYDLKMFLRFIKIRFNLTDETDFSKIKISDISIKTIRKIQLSDIHAFLSYMAIELKSKSATRARKASTIRVFFNYLSQKANLITINPAQNLETPKSDKRLPKYLNLEESKKLLEASSDEDNRNYQRDYAITTLFLNCGLRLSELVGINIQDIDFSEAKLNVIGKGNKERTIYLNRACLKALSDYLFIRPQVGVKVDKLNSDKALFLSERKERISRRTVQYIISKELQKAGLDSRKFSVHTHVDNTQVRNAVESNPLADM